MANRPYHNVVLNLFDGEVQTFIDFLEALRTDAHVRLETLYRIIRMHPELKLDDPRTKHTKFLTVQIKADPELQDLFLVLRLSDLYIVAFYIDRVIYKFKVDVSYDFDTTLFANQPASGSWLRFDMDFIPSYGDIEGKVTDRNSISDMRMISLDKLRASVERLNWVTKSFIDLQSKSVDIKNKEKMKLERIVCANTIRMITLISEASRFQKLVSLIENFDSKFERTADMLKLFQSWVVISREAHNNPTSVIVSLGNDLDGTILNSMVNIQACLALMKYCETNTRRRR